MVEVEEGGRERSLPASTSMPGYGEILGIPSSLVQLTSITLRRFVFHADYNASRDLSL